MHIPPFTLDNSLGSCAILHPDRVVVAKLVTESPTTGIWVLTFIMDTGDIVTLRGDPDNRDEALEALEDYRRHCTRHLPAPRGGFVP